MNQLGGTEPHKQYKTPRQRTAATPDDHNKSDIPPKVKRSGESIRFLLFIWWQRNNAPS